MNMHLSKPNMKIHPMNRKNILAFLLVTPVLFGGCGRSMVQTRISEGTIEYDITFPDYDPNGLMAGMLPEKTQLYFDAEHQVADLSAGMGVFRTSLIANTQKQLLDYHMSVMSKKLVSELGPKDLVQFNKDSQAMTIVYTNVEDTIAGYPCKKAIAIYSGLEQPEVELWYTTSINMDRPNWFGPYSDIPGVLLQYEMIQYGMRMKLRASKVTPGPLDAQRLVRKLDHDLVEPAVLQHELQEVLSTFSS
jgi:hypothetical protein